jgi:hypothetical protein
VTIYAVDSNVLIAWASPHAPASVRSRLDYFLAELRKADRVVIPTPVLAEFMVSVEQSADLLALLDGRRQVVVAPFCRRAAAEHAILTRDQRARDRNRRTRTRARAVCKFDHQVVAIAKVERADVVISDDKDLRRDAIRAGMKALAVEELPEPPVPPQQSLPFEAPPAWLLSDASPDARSQTAGKSAQSPRQDSPL